MILNRFSPRLIRLRRRLVRTMSDTDTNKNRGAYESLSPQAGKKGNKKNQREGCDS